MKKILKPVIVALGIILVLFMLLAPTIIKAYVNKNGKAYVGRALNINKLRVNYFSSTIRVIGFSLFEKDDTTEFIGFDTLSVNLRPLRLLSNEFHIQQLLLVNPRGIILQNDTVFNFDDLMAQSDSVASVDRVSDSASMPYKLNLNQLEMRNGGFIFTDIPLNHSIHTNKLNFIIPQIYWNSADSSQAGLTFDLSEGGHFESNMNYKVETGEFKGNIEISSLVLQTFLPYIQQQINFSDVDGTFGTHISFQGSVHNLEELLVKGTMQVNNLMLKDDVGKNVLGVDSCTVVLKKVLPNIDYYELDKITMTRPYVYFSLIDSVSNFEKLLPTPFDTVSETTADTLSSETEMYVRLNQFDINNGQIDFNDQRLQNEFNYELSELQLNVDTLDLVADWVNLTGTMKLNKRGMLEAQLGLNPSNIMDSVQLNYVVSDFQLPDLNIYSKHYVGLPILFGDMYYVSKTSIVNKQLVSNNELIIRNVDMGRKAGGLYDIPLKLALFILKDINGDIKLEIPVKGDLDNPETKVGPIVVNTLKSFVFKVVASPFKALGGLLGASPDEISGVTFDYADTTLTNKQARTLSLLLDLEHQKPELQTDLIYFNDKELEKLDAAREISHKMYWDKKQKDAGSNMKDYTRFLAKATGKDSLVLQDYEVLLSPLDLVDSVLAQRERVRFAIIKEFLNEQNDSTKIRLIPYNTGKVLNNGSRPHFEVKVNLAEDVNQ